MEVTNVKTVALTEREKNVLREARSIVSVLFGEIFPNTDEELNPYLVEDLDEILGYDNFVIKT